MNKIYFQIVSIFIIVFSLSTAFAQPDPTFDMTVRNITITGPGNTVSFEVWLKWTNYPSSNRLEFAAGQYTWTCNRALMGTANPGMTFARSGNGPGFSSYAPPLNGAVDSLTAPPGQLYLKLAGNNPNSELPPYIVSASGIYGGRIFNATLVNQGGAAFPSVPLNLRFKLGAAPNTFVAYFLPVTVPDTELAPPQLAVSLMDTVVNHYTVIAGDTVPPPPTPVLPVANFYSNTRSITAGGSVNFLDSTLNAPTSWLWTFQGGTPGNSNVKNPAGIVYNTPGTYSVTLTATNSVGPNTITKNNYITVSPAGCIATWKNTIKISDAANVKDSLILGTAPTATNGIDTCLGETPLPPVPPSGAFDVRFLLPNPPTNDASKRDFRLDPSNDMFWTMSFQPSSAGYPITFTWDNTAFPSTGLFYLKDLIGGIVVNINMKNQNSYTLTNTGITSLKIEFSYFITMPLTVKANWNIISVPLKSTDMSVARIFPNAASLAYKYSGSYVPADSFANGKGYWLKFNRDTTYNQTGLVTSPKNIPVSSGWNLIGPFDENIPVTSIISVPSGIVTSSYYGYVSAYTIADTLKKGKGYWVQANATGILMKNTAENMIVSNAGDSLNNFTRIMISDRDNNSSTLYLANSNQISQNYDLPPAPPQGIFDVRFGSDKIVESFGQDHNIKFNSASIPVRIKIENMQNHRLRLIDAVTGNIFNKVIEEGVEIELNQNLDNLILVEESILPVTYSLSQNYPNPFNPSTTIKYQIPADGNVRIIIYDVLGKEVQMLVNRFEKAGNYEISFNASNLASGVYFYKMQSGSFSDIKRMLILK